MDGTKFEKFQQRAACFVTNIISTQTVDMVHRLSWSTLETYRREQRLVLFHKTVKINFLYPDWHNIGIH